MSETLDTLKVLHAGGRAFRFHDLGVIEAAAGHALSRLPVTTKILLENLIRNASDDSAKLSGIAALVHRKSDAEFAFRPARIVMPDSSGIPLLADLTAMREWLAEQGGDPSSVNPLVQVDMIVDHSATVEHWGSSDAIVRNREMEYARNGERYRFLKWAASAFERFTLFPPSSGIIHQINIEHLARPVRAGGAADGAIAYPDTLVGLDSHTPMVNGLGVLGWGVGGIEAAAVMLGEPITMPVLPVVGCRFIGRLRPGITSTDLVLTVTERLREHDVVGKIVEFTGPGLANLPVADRCTIANMAAEYGANMGFFPIDALTLDYLRTTGRSSEDIALAEAYARRQGMWGSSDDIDFDSLVEIDLSQIETSVAGPSKPQQRNRLADVPLSFRVAFPDAPERIDPFRDDRVLVDGDVVIAAITSCTNTSNPALLMAAGLLAEKAVRRGLRPKSWVKTSFSPGSPVAASYLAASGLQTALDALGFNIVGFGCMTCAGQSGPLAAPIAAAISTNGVKAAAVLSSNRNFEGRIHPSVVAGYLASPPLVVAYALAGSVLIDFTSEPLGVDGKGVPVFLSDIWPSPEEIDGAVRTYVNAELFQSTYSDLAGGDETWRNIPAPAGAHFNWDDSSTFLRRPPFMSAAGQSFESNADIVGARVLAKLGSMVTTDHISPSGAIPAESAAGSYLLRRGVAKEDLQSYIVRRTEHDVMLRGTFANQRLVNFLCPDLKGGVTRHFPSGDVLPIHEAAARYRASNEPMIVIAGREYGMGSSRDWAAKGPYLLGIRAVLAEGFERIHRANLVGMGILPLQLPAGFGDLLDGTELFDIPASEITSCNQTLRCTIRRSNGAIDFVTVKVCIPTENELEWLAHGGILPFVARRLLKAGQEMHTHRHWG